MKQIRAKWDGGIDLHGQLIDRAFSFTLLGAGHVALDTYTEWKSIYVDFSGRLQRAQIDNQ